MSTGSGDGDSEGSSSKRGTGNVTTRNNKERKDGKRQEDKPGECAMGGGDSGRFLSSSSAFIAKCTQLNCV